MFELTPEREALRQRARALAEGVFRARAAEIDRTEAYPHENVRALGEAGFLGMTIPAALGGGGRDFLDAALVVAEVAKACGATARIVVEANLGAIAAVMAYGSEAQRRLAAGLVLGGDKPAICITEPGAGSAAGEMATTARRVPGGWVMNGTKHWITGGGVSRLHLVFARMVEDGEATGIGGFLAVRGEAEGLKVGAREPTMGLRGMPETEIVLEDLFVPDAMALVPGGPEAAFGRLMAAYNSQRVGAAAVALGLGQGAFGEALTYVQEREQFGRPIAEFQGLQWMLADMSIALAAAEALVWKAAGSAPKGGFPDRFLAAQAKVLAAETAVKVTNDALQLHGAAGYSRNRPLERMVRDARMFTIGGGTAQVLRNQVAEGLLGRKLPQSREGEAPRPGWMAAE